MRWLQIARKDFDDSRRERQLYYLLALFGLVGLGIGYFVGDNSAMADARILPFFLLNLFGFLAPIAALTISQGDIVGKRATGELSVLLSLPFSRHAIVLGSFIGRVAISTAILLVTFVLAIAVATAMGAPFEAGLLVGTFLLVWAIGVIFAAIALGISALTRSTTIAAGGSFGAFLLFVFQLWSLIPTGIRYVIGGLSIPAGPRPEWAVVFNQLSPFAGLRNLAQPFLPDLLGDFPLAPGAVGASPPWYQEPVFAGFVVLAWIVLPLAIGFWRFQTTDL
ncbi:ABC transporter permease subunit [Halorhabdus amylolytica]|uniref:ABC transporter permease subunit n=1 Tax=Halorhabdus amylolytica TaxID=2559573 RepID=UPI0010AA4EDA|nr:ABC transporter permease subunit [Halorhabdus amylolytica]